MDNTIREYQEYKEKSEQWDALDKSMIMEWVYIKDRLPPKDLEVLATNEEDKWVVMAILKTKCWYNSWDYINNEKCPIYPTHWMYKPDPPQTNKKTV